MTGETRRTVLQRIGAAGGVAVGATGVGGGVASATERPTTRARARRELEATATETLETLADRGIVESADPGSLPLTPQSVSAVVGGTEGVASLRVTHPSGETTESLIVTSHTAAGEVRLVADLSEGGARAVLDDDRTFTDHGEVTASGSCNDQCLSETCTNDGQVYYIRAVYEEDNGDCRLKTYRCDCGSP